MSQQVACPHCGALLVNDGSLSGRVARCPTCSGSFQMPLLPALQPEPPAATPGVAIEITRPGGHGGFRVSSRQRSTGNTTVVLFVVGGIALCAFCCCGLLGFGVLRGPDENQDTPARSSSRRSSTTVKKWYEGGTLHNAGALEWQKANHGDKLATCSDFVAKLWEREDFKPSIRNSIHSVEDMRPYAQELVDFLDAATRKGPDPDKNRMLYTNQKVSEMAAIGIVMMQWGKSD